MARVSKKEVPRIANSFLGICELSEPDRLRLAGHLANMFLKKSQLSAKEREMRLDDFMFNVGEFVAAIPVLFRAIEEFKNGRTREFDAAMHNALLDVVNHLQAAGKLYTDNSLIDLAASSPKPKMLKVVHKRVKKASRKR